MSKPAKILLTGATGYIGSHAWVALSQAGWDVVGVDNFANSHPAVLEGLTRLLSGPLMFECADVGDAAAMSALFARHRIDAVMHFAALKSVPESLLRPLDYMAVNVGGLLTLTQVMQAHNVQRLVFSSTAALYGASQPPPLREDAALEISHPYARSKWMGERLLADLLAAFPAWRVATLRYFNPAGAHESGLIGERPRGPADNLMPCLGEVALGLRPHLWVYGRDYPTPDGTGLRDYLHVQDIADGHVSALEHLMEQPDSFTLNLGRGEAVSVLQMIAAYAQACGRPIPYRVIPRRAGDVAASWADCSQAAQRLGWQAQRDVAAMCRDSWRWLSAAQTSSALPAPT
ncbi:UDP-glucose 4-epimerase GalE [Ideonella paludis]|uniref:UDP-glucose 4-epimerase n=1 Tax=Ideonella paludis TaxID=1233411 RepID=A0ABS5DS80_9BURK|nr:UDP-glucose 4-epimerase GalE [Ideonella paludis]MBQ0933960.1 UDP-glucose 4-epimerase GalE [Ideonella paludis]